MVSFPSFLTVKGEKTKAGENIISMIFLNPGLLIVSELKAVPAPGVCFVHFFASDPMPEGVLRNNHTQRYGQTIFWL